MRPAGGPGVLRRARRRSSPPIRRRRATRCALRAFAAAGVGPGPAPDGTRGAGRAFAAAAADAPRLVDRLVAVTQAAGRRTGGGWSTSPPDIARFGRDYPTRAVVTKIGLGANTAEKALYPNTSVDSARAPPRTAATSTRSASRRGRRRPCSAFWSITLYDDQLLFYDNPLEPLRAGRPDARPAPRRRRRPDDPRLARAPPAGRARANWLPAPGGPVRALPAPVRAARRGGQRALAAAARGAGRC